MKKKKVKKKRTKIKPTSIYRVFINDCNDYTYYNFSYWIVVMKHKFTNQCIKTWL